MERLKWDVQDDPVILEDATIDTVRERFKQYRSPTAPGPANVHDEARKGWKGCLSTDYNFCIRINEASLASVLDEAPQPLPRGELGIPYVDLVDVGWSFQSGLRVILRRSIWHLWIKAIRPWRVTPLAAYRGDAFPWLG